jgi:hypothetical protein
VQRRKEKHKGFMGSNQADFILDAIIAIEQFTAGVEFATFSENLEK